MMESSQGFSLTEAETSRIVEVQRLARAGAVPDVLEGLTDASWAVRREVVNALARLGAASVKPLCALLRDRRDSESRLAAAVDALAGNSHSVLSAVTELARDPNPAVVADAAQILGRRRDAAAVPLLIELMSHADDNVVVAAIEALGRIGGPSGIDALVAAVKTGNFFRVFPAIDVLGRSGDPRAIDPLTSLLKDSTYALEAARALGRTGATAAVAPLAALLTQGSESTVRIAAGALFELHTRHQQRYGSAEGPEQAMRLARPGPAALGRVAHALSNADSSEQVALSFVLGLFGGEEARGGLTALLDSAEPVAQAAASALKQLGPEAELAIRTALREGNSARRQMLLQATLRASAVPEIIECLSDESAMVRVLACDSLARIGATAAVPKLFALLRDPNLRVAQAAIGAIQSLGNHQTEPLALSLAREGSPAERRAALRILAYFGYLEALPLFVEALDSEDARLRDAALAGLAILEDPRALDALLSAARSPVEKTRSGAMRALGQCTRRDARISAYLLTGLKDADAWVRYYACQALGRLELESAVPGITVLLDDEAGQVRVAAVEALSHFQSDGALKALLKAAEAGESDVQRAALIGLGFSKRPEALPTLLSAALAPEAATRLVAISALAGSSSPHALPTLAKAARDQDENVRTAALGYIAAMPNLEATTVLIEMLRDTPETESTIQLLSLPTEGRVPGILVALEAADAALAQVLVAALVRLHTGEATTALFSVLATGPVTARRAAASALAVRQSNDALMALKKAAESDPDAQVREVASILVAQ